MTMRAIPWSEPATPENRRKTMTVRWQPDDIVRVKELGAEKVNCCRVLQVCMTRSGLSYEIRYWDGGRHYDVWMSESELDDYVDPTEGGVGGDIIPKAAA